MKTSFNSKPCGACNRLMPTSTRAKAGYCSQRCRTAGRRVLMLAKGKPRIGRKKPKP